MRGEVLAFDAVTGTGSIVGDDGARYRFEATDVRSPLPLPPRQRVDFVADADRQARDIMTMAMAADTTSRAVGAGFDLGRVIQKTFAVIAGNWMILLVASAVLVGIPSVIASFGQGTLFTSPSSGSLIAMTVGGLLTLVGTIILQGVVVRVAVNGFHGRTSRLRDALEVGVVKFLPLLGLAIVMGVAITLGFILLVVPGAILMVLWAVAAPSVVVEKRGVFDALQRSRDLTRGYRWSVFGLVVIYFVVSMIIGMMAGAVSVATGGTFDSMGGSPNLAVNLIVGPLTNIISGVVSAAGVAAMYHELRVAKEGAGVENLASVFD